MYLVENLSKALPKNSIRSDEQTIPNVPKFVVEASEVVINNIEWHVTSLGSLVHVSDGSMKGRHDTVKITT